MTRQILVVVDKEGNAKDKNGNAYGFFLSNEKELCESYCKAYGFKYETRKINIC